MTAVRPRHAGPRTCERRPGRELPGGPRPRYLCSQRHRSPAPSSTSWPATRRPGCPRHDRVRRGPQPGRRPRRPPRSRPSAPPSSAAWSGPRPPGCSSEDLWERVAVRFDVVAIVFGTTTKPRRSPGSPGPSKTDGLSPRRRSHRRRRSLPVAAVARRVGPALHIDVSPPGRRPSANLSHSFLERLERCRPRGRRLQTHSFWQQNSPSFWICTHSKPSSQLVSLASTFLPMPPSLQSSSVVTGPRAHRALEHVGRRQLAVAAAGTRSGCLPSRPPCCSPSSVLQATSAGAFSSSRTRRADRCSSAPGR
jgi:hypothetical protein